MTLSPEVQEKQLNNSVFLESIILVGTVASEDVY